MSRASVLLCACAGVIVAGLAGQARGQVIAYEPFPDGSTPASGQYTLSADIRTFQTTTTGFLLQTLPPTGNSWDGTSSNYSVRADKSVPLPVHSAMTWQNGTYLRWGGTSGTEFQRRLRRGLQTYTPGNTYYFSAFIGRESWSGTGTFGAGLVGAEHFAGFTSNTGAFTSTTNLTEGFQWGFAVSDSANNPRLVVRTPGTGGGTPVTSAIAGTNTSFGRNFLMVFKLEVDVSGTQDRLSYWAAGQVLTANSFTPSAANVSSEAALTASIPAVSTNGRDYRGEILGDIVSSNTAITEFSLLNPRGSGVVYHDEIRMGTSFADVVPYDAAPVDYTWNVDGNGTWIPSIPGAVAQNWTSAAIVPGNARAAPNAGNASAIFGPNITTASTITLNAPVTLRKLTFNTSAPVTINGVSGTTQIPLTLYTGNGDRTTVDVQAGSHVVNNLVMAVTGADINVASGASLVLNLFTGQGRSESVTKSGAGTLVSANYVGGPITSISGGLFDIQRGYAILRNQSEDSVRTLIAAWYNGGARNGVGLGSAFAGQVTADPRDVYATLALRPNATGLGFNELATFSGVSTNSADLLVRYTYVGDTNLDGLLDARDYNAVLNGWSNALTGWKNGDVNYDGVVDSSDWSLFLNAYTWYLSNGTPFDTSGDLPAGAIPEPLALGLLAPALPLLGRRRTPRR